MTPQTRHKPRLDWLFVLFSVFWIGFVIYLNSQPLSFFGTYRFRWWHAIPHLDKLVHFTMYGVMATLLCKAVITPNRPPAVRAPLLFSFLVAAFVGGIDEINQWFIPGRTCSIYDFAADCVGALLAISIFVFVSRNSF